MAKELLALLMRSSNLFSDFYGIWMGDCGLGCPSVDGFRCPSEFSNVPLLGEFEQGSVDDLGAESAPQFEVCHPPIWFFLKELQQFFAGCHGSKSTDKHEDNKKEFIV